jgi:trehalose-phosphatase
VLAGKPDIILGIVSGRDFNNLRLNIGIDGLLYASNHGFKIQGRFMQFEIPVPAYARKTLSAFCLRLAGKIGRMEGVLLERKKFSIALHYRLVPAENLPLLKTAFRELFESYRQCGLEMRMGKKIIEVMPAIAWNKGKAVLRILGEVKALRDRAVLTIYIGDDITDEDVFKVLHARDISVKVGVSKATSANYRLAGPQEVSRFLTLLQQASV